MNPEALLDGLDEAQRAAVTSTAMPLVILAPAGSGKTRVLTRRVAHQVAADRIDARHVLALTFTRKAAFELTSRLRRLGLRDEATAGTFHAVAWGVLRARWSDQRRTAPALLDRKGRILAELAPKVPGRSQGQVAAGLATEIEWAKARMITPDTYAGEAHRAGRRPGLRLEAVAEAYAAYETRKHRARLVDFDDLLALCARAIEEDPTFAATQRWRFRHLFVDELQDVNPLQFRLLEAWRGERYDVTVVGDPQQAIYGWNGADAGFLIDIHRHWPPAEVVQLVHSYRSTPEILTSAAAVLRAARQPAQAVVAARPSGPAPRLTAHADDRREALAVVRAVRLAHAPGRPWADQAVLVRTNAQTVLLAEALRASGVPHRVRDGSPFLERREIKAALRDLRGSAAPLGTALADLEAAADEMALASARRPEDLDETARPGAGDDEAAALLVLVRMGQDYLRLDPLGRPDTFARWLTATVQAEGEGGPGGDAVDVATFHAAKGLEWGVVHLAGLEDGYVPIAHARTPADRAEEARLLYVAMTRAQRELHLTWARQRTFGTKVVERERSPLLDPVVAATRPPTTTDHGAPSSTDLEPPTGWEAHLAAQRQALENVQRAEDPSLASLHRWRERAARAARIDPEAVLPDHVLTRVARAHPSTLEELREVRGVGALLAGRLGPDLLEAMGGPPDGGSGR